MPFDGAQLPLSSFFVLNMLLTLAYFSIAGLFLINFKESFVHSGEESLARVSFRYFFF